MEMEELFNENFWKLGAAAQRVSPLAKFRFAPAFSIRTLPRSYAR